jgi:GT2 family glycosyltransferase
MISLIIPTYNGARFLDEMIQSVWNQTVLPSELIIVDDASTDGTPSLLKQYQSQSSFPITIIQQQQNSGGPSTPMNVGIAAAKSPVIAMLDQDDVMTRDRLEIHQYAFSLEDPKLDLHFGMVSRMDGQGSKEQTFFRIQPDRLIALAEKADPINGIWEMNPAKLYLDVLVHGAVVGASNMAFRKSLWEKLGGFREDHRICWDYEFFCQATQIAKIGFVEQRLAWYRMHDANFHASSDRGSQEWLELLCRHEANPLLPIDRKPLQNTLKNLLMDRGYHQAKQGRATSAIASYKRAIQYGESSLDCVWQSSKALLHFFRHYLKPASQR